MDVVALAGYDAARVQALVRGHRRRFVVMALCALSGALLCGVGIGYGVGLAMDSVAVGCVVGFCAGGMVLDLYRLFHAGTGFPLHWPAEAIEDYVPGLAAPGVFVSLGALLAWPVALLLQRPALNQVLALRAELARGLQGAAPVDGLVTRAHIAFENRALVVPTILIILCSSVLVGMPALLRFLWVGSLRAYERERWIGERMQVDDAFAQAQDDITALLDGVPGFSGRLAVHYADPPYNTRPLLYGLDVRALHGDRTLIAARRAEPAPPVSPPPSELALPPPQGEPVVEAATLPVLPLAKPVPAPVDLTPPLGLDDATDDSSSAAPAAAFVDMARTQVGRARTHVAAVAPFVARLTELPTDTVLERLVRAAPDARLHMVFPEMKQLRTLLLKDARFAEEHGLAPILAIIVARPVADVQRRLRSAPPDRKLTGVFAPELARRLLNKDVATRT